MDCFCCWKGFVSGLVVHPGDCHLVDWAAENLAHPCFDWDAAVPVPAELYPVEAFDRLCFEEAFAAAYFRPAALVLFRCLFSCDSFFPDSLNLFVLLHLHKWVLSQ